MVESGLIGLVLYESNVAKDHKVITLVLNVKKTLRSNYYI